jgi:hypothetical protein
VAVGGGLLGLLLEPVRQRRRGARGVGGLRSLNVDREALVLLEAAGEVGLLGGRGGLGGGEGPDLALGVRLLGGRGLVRLELLEVELLDEVGWGRER